MLFEAERLSSEESDAVDSFAKTCCEEVLSVTSPSEEAAGRAGPLFG